MPQEAITIHVSGLPATAGHADIVRTSGTSRMVQAGVWVIGGLIGGTACIIIPIVHLFTTWGLPLLGIVMAVRTMRRDVVMHDPEFPCPKCAQPIQLHGGVASDPSWQRCSECHTAIEIRPRETAVPAG